MNEQSWYIKETLNYRKDRYMDHLSDNELFIRAKDIIINCMEINNKGQISAVVSDDWGQFFWVRCTHIIEEYKLRFGDFRKKFDEQNITGLNIPKNFPLMDKACSKINNMDNDKSRLYKYGKLEYLESYLKKGNLRIFPASAYKDPSLNHAIYDDELSFFAQNNPSQLKAEVFDKFGNFKDKIEPVAGKFEIKSTTNFYVFCLSYVLSPRLFVDFDNVDSCLIIDNYPAFIDRLIIGFSQMKEGFEKSFGIIQYVDPIFTEFNNFDIFYTKHFRYAYQKEFRSCFIPYAVSIMPKLERYF